VELPIGCGLQLTRLAPVSGGVRSRCSGAPACLSSAATGAEP